ncbi:DNA polymerase 3 [Talaromyces islandicus]|uniref:DNA polymerase 3 n=1 Tax=Talaromyces islandicus TaxID=28573 RepID=A0A0U1LUY6_TALIS|nr:DNA polymerase 3 [Talaromyces islandicus]
MNSQSVLTSKHREQAHEASAVSPLAYLSGVTASPPSAATSPGADRFRGLHIRTGSSSSSGNGSPIHTPVSASSNKQPPSLDRSGLLAESYNHAKTQKVSEGSIPTGSGQPQSHRVSHDPDALSNVARGSLHSSPANSQFAGFKQINDHENQHDSEPQRFPGPDGSETPHPTLPTYQPKSEPSSCEEHKPSGMFLQPEAHIITEDQLINEVRAIYAGLVMVEKKCIDIDKQQSENRDELKDVQWQALIALHRTLLHEHYDFFLASNHPLASTVLKKLADKYSMPSRMWRYGIHSFLELLRKRLPGSLEHMLTFIYMAYSMMTLLLESIPAFEGTWIECLGDLARYRMAIEEVDMRDRDTWSAVSRYWYGRAADKTPEVGRLQHHHAVLARPNLLQQLFYYSKALTSTEPFTNARDSISLVFGPLLDSSRSVNPSNPLILATFVKVHGLLFTRGEIAQSLSWADEFLGQFDAHIASAGTVFREQAVYITSANYAAIFDFGHTDARLYPMFAAKNFQKPKSEMIDAASQHWKTKPHEESIIGLRKAPNSAEMKFETSDQTVSFASHLAFLTLDAILQHIGDRRVLPSAHLSLAFLWCLALVPKSMEYIQADVPWKRIVTFLNSLIKPETDMTKIASEEFPVHETGSARQLPEDFYIRGLAWGQLYYPVDFFNETADYEERSIELPSAIVPRTRRCLWLGLQIAKLKCWIEYDQQERNFCATQFADQLSELAGQHRVLGVKSEQPDADITMAD